MNELAEAYRATRYTVFTPRGAVSVRVGEPEAQLDRLIQSERTGKRPKSWGIITACNPRSQRLDPATNGDRNAVLKNDLEQLAQILRSDHDRQLLILPARGASPDGTWAEDGFWVGGISENELLVLGARHEQNAVLTAVADGPPTVAWVVVRPVQAHSTPVKGSGTADLDVGAIEALRAIRDALLARRTPTDATLAASALPWVRIAEEMGEIPPQVDPTELSELAVDLEHVPGCTFEADAPTDPWVRCLAVSWSDGPPLEIAVEMTETSGALVERAVGFALDPDEAIASLFVGQAVRWEETSDEPVTLAAVDLVKWAQPD